MPQVELVRKKKGSFVRDLIVRIWTERHVMEARVDVYLEEHPSLLQKLLKALSRSPSFALQGFGTVTDRKSARSLIIQRWPGTIEKAISILLEFEHAIDATNARLKVSQ